MFYLTNKPTAAADREMQSSFITKPVKIYTGSNDKCFDDMNIGNMTNKL